jgi:hypothetical protein
MTIIPLENNKARVFRSALQIEKKDALKLLAEILKGIKHREAIEGKHDSYGKRLLM